MSVALLAIVVFFLGVIADYLHDILHELRKMNEQ